MATQDREIAENILRLLKKAKVLNRYAAAIYLDPLARLGSHSDVKEASLAAASLAILVRSLQSSTDNGPIFWDDAIDAVKAWRDAS
jgi:hypothetical protein